MAHIVTASERDRVNRILAALERGDGATALALGCQVSKRAIAEKVHQLVDIGEAGFAALLALCQGNGELLKLACSRLEPAEEDAVTDSWLHLIGEKPVRVDPPPLADLALFVCT